MSNMISSTFRSSGERLIGYIEHLERFPTTRRRSVARFDAVIESARLEAKSEQFEAFSGYLDGFSRCL